MAIIYLFNNKISVCCNVPFFVSALHQYQCEIVNIKLVT